MRKMFLLLVMSLITVFLLTNPLVSMANVRLEWVSGYGYGGPFYANLGAIMPDGNVYVLHTDEWAAIPFYRDPDCVPLDFNLVNFADFENDPLSCYSFVEGFEVWKNGPGIDFSPIQVKLKAAEPMPVYFIPWPILQEALEDYVLTMPELEALEGLRIGIATFFTETLHDWASAKQPKEEDIAKGYMTDNGDRFELKFTWVKFRITNAKIEFKPAKSAPALKSQSKLAATWGEMKGKN